MSRQAVRTWEPTSGPGGVNDVGKRATASWLRERGESPPALTPWHCEIAMSLARERPSSDFDDRSATRFHLDLYREEWGMYFCHRGRASWIRITDIAFVHGRDDYALLAHVPSLPDIGLLLRRLEASHGIYFQRAHAAVKTNVPRIEPSVRAWLSTL